MKQVLKKLKTIEFKFKREKSTSSFVYECDPYLNLDIFDFHPKLGGWYVHVCACARLSPVWGGEQAQQVLGGEDHDARRVQTEEDDFVALAAGQGAAATRLDAARHRLDDVGHHGHGYEEAGHVIEDQRRRRRVRVLERSPHFLP
jgi:hypothetical protein